MIMGFWGTETGRLCTAGMNHFLIILRSTLTLHLKLLRTIMSPMTAVLELCIVRLHLVKMIIVCALKIK